MMQTITFTCDGCGIEIKGRGHETRTARFTKNYHSVEVTCASKDFCDKCLVAIVTNSPEAPLSDHQKMMKALENDKH